MPSRDPLAIVAAIEEADRTLAAVQTDWLLNKQYCRGQQWVEVDPDNGNIAPPAKKRWQKRITANTLYNHRQMIVAKMLAQEPVPTVMPVSSAEEDRAVARECEYLIKSFWREHGMPEELVYHMIDMVEVGGGWLRVQWNPEGGDFIEVPDEALQEVADGMGEDVAKAAAKRKKQKTGALEVQFVSNFEMRVDPSARRLSEARWLARVTYMHVDEIWERWRKKVDGEASPGPGLTINPDLYLNIQRTQAENMAKVVCFWERPTKKYAKGYYAVVIAGEIVEEDDELPCGDFPYDYCPFAPDPDQFHGITPVSFARRMQREVNQNLSLMVEGRNRNLFGVWKQPRGCDMDIPTGEPGEILSYNESSGSPTFEQQAPVSPQVYDMTALFDRYLSKIMGVNPDMDDSATSGKDRLYAAEEDNTKLGPSLQVYKAFLKRIAIKMLKTWREYATTELKYTASDPNAFSDVRAFDASKIRFRDVDMGIESSLPLNKQARREQILTLYQAGLVPQDQALKLLEMGDLDDALGSRNLDKERARNENQILYEQWVAPEMHEDHAVHAEVHLAEMKQAKWYALDEQRKAFFRQHLQIHLSFMQVPAMQAGPAPSSPGGGGEMAEVPATSEGSVVPTEAPVTPNDQAGLEVINGRAA